MSQSQDKPQVSISAELDEGPVVQWHIHPVTRRPWVSTAVTFVILLFAALVFYSTDSKLFTVFSLVVLAASLAKFYFPTTYRLTSNAVQVKTTTQTLTKQWSLFRSYWPDKNGVLLSPFPVASRLENFRGLYLIFGDNRDEVMRFIESKIPRPETGETL